MSSRLGMAASCRKKPTKYLSRARGLQRSEARPGRYHGPFQACALVLRRCAEGSGTGARIAAALAPADDDYIVLEPKHSAFFATPLDLLLRHLRARRVVITGVATDQCIFLTAVEARMQDYAVAVPEDCVAAQTRGRLQPTRMSSRGVSQRTRGPPPAIRRWTSQVGGTRSLHVRRSSPQAFSRSPAPC